MLHDGDDERTETDRAEGLAERTARGAGGRVGRHLRRVIQEIERRVHAGQRHVLRVLDDLYSIRFERSRLL